MVTGGHERSWLVVVVILARREYFTRTSRIGDRFQKQALLCLHVTALDLVHRPQRMRARMQKLS